MASSPAKNSFLKLLALFTVIRGYNVALLVLAMYLTAYFIFAKDTTLIQFFSEYKLHLIVLASAFTVSGGYIINNFYDLDKDKVSRPLTTYISRFIRQDFKLNVYLVLSAIGLILAFAASWRVGIYFIVYQFLVWFYCHKLSKITFIHNLFYVILSMLPFLALLLFYNNYLPIVFFHGLFLGLILLIMDIAKDFVTYKADLIYSYNTLPVTLGTRKTKVILTLVILASLTWTLVMAQFPEVGHMKIYFWLVALFLVILITVLWLIHEHWQYHLFFLSVKFMLGIGVLSIAWIKINPLALQRFFPL